MSQPDATTGVSPPVPVADPCAFEEFQLYYESTEKVTDRRLEANRWNYSISVAILAAIAGAYGWSTAHSEFFLLTAFVILLLSSAAAIFCLFWLRQVQDWKALNNAKFQVLSQMAAGLHFPNTSGPRPIPSYRPFDREWKILQDQDGLGTIKVHLGQIEALNASGAELFMPRMFMFIFGLIFTSILLVMPLTWPSLPHSIVPEKQAPAATSTVSPTSPTSEAKPPAPSPAVPQVGGCTTP